jgi:hypothetical protein
VLFAVSEVGMGERHQGRLVEEDRRPSCRGQPAGAGLVVGLHVSLEDVRDAHGFLSGGLEIGLDLQLWIHHSAGACAPSAEQIARTARLRRQKLSKDHGPFLLGLVLPPQLL